LRVENIMREYVLLAAFVLLSEEFRTRERKNVY